MIFFQPSMRDGILARIDSAANSVTFQDSFPLPVQQWRRNALRASVASESLSGLQPEINI